MRQGQLLIQDSLAGLAPMRRMGSRLRDALKGIIFHPLKAVGSLLQLTKA